MQTYTFHVSIPNTGRVWRKVELTAEQTLADLHMAIQDAFEFDAAHLYSFFMSGRAWDHATEYCPPEAAGAWTEDDDLEFLDELDSDDDHDGEALSGEEEDELLDKLNAEDDGPPLTPEQAQAIMATLGDGQPPETFEDLMRAAEENPALRGELVKAMVAQTGVPAGLADLIFRNAGKLSSMPVEQFADEVLSEMPAELADELMESGYFDDFPEPGDSRTTALGSLDLKKGKTFLYLFDYGDEWHFKVRVHAVNPQADPSVQYPRLVESVGVAPEQYKWFDEDEDEDA
jgi:hypothetical protein